MLRKAELWRSAPLAPDAKPAPKKPPLGLRDLPAECTAVLKSGGGEPVVAADGTVPAALKAAAGKDAGPPIPKLDPVAYEALKAELAARDFAAVMDRIAGAITTPAVWGSGPEAAPDDVLVTWQQLVALHRQWHSLTKELKDAEQALGQDASEANYLRLRDVKTRLSRMDGTEALIEGFGASSGRGVRSL